MFVLIISRGIPTPQDPQWGCFEKDQAEALASLGHKVVVASVDSRFRMKWRHLGITHEKINNVDFYNLFIIPGAVTELFGSHFNWKVKQWQFRNLYRHIINEYGQPDIIYGQFFFNSYLALPISISENIPLVNIEHAARFNDEHIDPLSIALSTEIYKHTKANIAVSDSLKKSLAKLFGIDCHVIHNVFGREFFYQPSAKQRHKVKFIATGSLVYRKGFDMFVKAFAMLNLPPDKWELNIIGEGPERNNLQAQIVATGLSENIRLLGSKNKIEIAQALNDSNVFVLPSRNENFSVSVLEALACGLPVIASICGGIKECIDSNNGLLFDVDDLNGLSKCLKYMFENHQNYNRQAIADDCRARFSSEVIAQQLTKIFEEVVNKK